MKKDIKNIEASVRALLQNKAKEIENFLIKPLNTIKKDHISSTRNGKHLVRGDKK